MFAMSQNPYTYAAAQAPRQYAPHGTSSAFSASANPDEDWTKISDLAERRRIQNRIAQRNYRKKLKRRLEDLERRAGSSDGSSPGNGSEKQPQQLSKSSKKQSSPKSQKPTAPPHKGIPAPQYTPPMGPEDEIMFASQYGDSRERSHTPPFVSYSAYPPPDEMILPPYGATAPYHTMSAADSYPSYATTVPCTLPSMTHFSDAIKREPYQEESLSAYVSYGFMPGMEVNNPYDNSNPHTPPLSHSFDHSANCSDSGYDYPTTPLSMPDSPEFLPHET